jgi:cell wall-associated NlpC family hydrolase
MLGALALLGLGAMMAVPAGGPTSVADRHRPHTSVEGRAPIADQAAPSRQDALPASTPRSNTPAPSALRVRGLRLDAGGGTLGKLAPPPPRSSDPTPGSSGQPGASGPSGPNAPSTGSSAGPTPPPVAVDGSAGARIIAEARKYLGVPYVYNGATPAGFDCSGYTMWVYSHAGVANLPHNSEAQRLVFRQIPQSSALPGDLIFYMSGGSSYHVAIYAGAGMQYAAPAPGQNVKVESIWSSDILFGTTWH